MAGAQIAAATTDGTHPAARVLGPRLLALVLDSAILGIVALVANGVYGVTRVTSGNPWTSGFSMFTTSTTLEWQWLTLIVVGYFTLFEALFGATPGKAWAGLRVVRVDGRPLTVGAVVLRNLMRVIDGLPFLYLVGGIAVVATRDSQRLGDKVAGTTVVSRRDALEPGATPAGGRGAVLTLAMVIGAAVLVTATFDYFGRPALLVRGDVNTGEMGQHVTSYQLGNANWGLGTVSYPIAFQTTTADCRGTINFTWTGVSWSKSGSQYECRDRPVG